MNTSTQDLNLDLDLNLLKVAASLYRHRNVSKAAKDLGLSQPSVSHALAKLRDHFGDALFVRSSRGVVATEFANSMESEILAVLERFSQVASRKAAFDPALAKGRITISTTDYFEIVILSKLMPVLAKEAPHLQISIRPTLGELPRRDIEDGKVDYAIAGFYQDLPEGFYRAKLFTDTFRCAARKDHPRLKGNLTLEKFYKESHALISLKGDFKVKDNPKLDQKRKITYGTFSFSSLPWILVKSDLLLTAPASLIESYTGFFPLLSWTPP